ncbi:MAG: EamA family transporter [Pseudomonadales bacterium]|nr:EamA family transporter [Pseudomonadales bacterium]
MAVSHPLTARSKAYLFLSVTALCWGANTVFAKLAVTEVSPMMLTSWRWLGVVILVWLIAYRDVRREWAEIRPMLGYLLAMGALGFTAFNALFYAAAHETTALNMGIIQGTIPVFVILFAFLVFGERVSALQLFGVGLTLTGVFLVAVEGDFSRLLAFVFNVGDVMIIAACLLYSGYTVWLRVKPKVSALTWFAMLATAAFVASIPLAFLEWQMGLAQWPTPTAWGLLALIVLFPSFIAQVFFIRGVEILGPGRAGIFVNLVPILASIAAVLVLGERFMWFHGAALILVLSGIAIAETFVRRSG